MHSLMNWKRLRNAVRNLARHKIMNHGLTKRCGYFSNGSGCVCMGVSTADGHVDYNCISQHKQQTRSDET